MSAPLGNDFATGNAGGRPSKYRDEFAQQAYKLCLLGHTDAELAEFFDVAESTVNEWKQQHEEFSESIKRGKAIADAEVVESLFKRATGYSHDDTHFSTYEGVVTETPTTKHYPPDPTALIFWLKNRQPKKWRDKHEVAVETNGVQRIRRDEESGDIVIDIAPE